VDLVELIKQIRSLSEKKSERYPSGRGDYKRGKKNPRKSRVRIFPTIKAALGKTKPGDKFSTKGAGRIYVTSKRSHGGTDSKSVVSGRIAKGFTPGSSTPNSHWSSITSHAGRIKDKYSGKKAAKKAAKKKEK
jgi:hypothetical protein